MAKPRATISRDKLVEALSIITAGLRPSPISWMDKVKISPEPGGVALEGCSGEGWTRIVVPTDFEPKHPLLVNAADLLRQAQGIPSDEIGIEAGARLELHGKLLKATLPVDLADGYDIPEVPELPAQVYDISDDMELIPAVKWVARAAHKDKLMKGVCLIGLDEGWERTRLCIEATDSNRFHHRLIEIDWTPDWMMVDPDQLHLALSLPGDGIKLYRDEHRLSVTTSIARTTMLALRTRSAWPGVGKVMAKHTRELEWKVDRDQLLLAMNGVIRATTGDEAQKAGFQRLAGSKSRMKIWAGGTKISFDTIVDFDGVMPDQEFFLSPSAVKDAIAMPGESVTMWRAAIGHFGVWLQAAPFHLACIMPMSGVK